MRRWGRGTAYDEAAYLVAENALFSAAVDPNTAPVVAEARGPAKYA
jgi:hypothetical protein